MLDLGSTVEAVKSDTKFRMTEVPEDPTVIEGRCSTGIGRLDPAARSKEEEIIEI